MDEFLFFLFLIAAALILLVLYCHRQDPRWPFYLAAWLGAVPGAVCGAYAMAAMTTMNKPFAADFAALIVGAPAGAVAGACAGVGIAACLKGPGARRVGVLLGALAGLLVAPLLMLLVPEWYFERLEGSAVWTVRFLSSLAFALFGAQLGVLYPRMRRSRERRALIGRAVAAVLLVGLAAGANRAAIRSHTRSVRQLSAARDVAGLRAKLRHPENERVWEAAVRAYAEADPVAALRDNNRFVRDTAAIVLGRRGDKRVVPILIEALQESPSEEAAAAAFGNRRVYRVILGLDPSLSEAAAAALGKTKDRRAVPALIAVLTRGDMGGSNWALRTSAATALGEIGDPRAIPALIGAIRFEPGSSGNVNEAARDALARINDPRQVPAVLQMLKNKDERVVAEAVWVLGRIGVAQGKRRDPRIVPALITVLTSYAHSGNSGLGGGRAAEALGEIGDPRAVPALIDAIHAAHRSQYTRLMAGAALPRIQDDRVLPALRLMLRDKDPDVRETAAHSVSQFPYSGRSREAFLRAYEAERRAIRK